MFERRDVLKAALGAVAAGIAPAARSFAQSFAQAALRGRRLPPPSPSLFPRHGRRPRARARRQALCAAVHRSARALRQSVLRAICRHQDQARRGHMVRREERLLDRAAASRLYLRGRRSTSIVVEDGAAARLAYDQSQIRLRRAESRRQALPDLGFSGFRVLYRARQRPRQRSSPFSRARASIARVARGQNLGVTARGLSIRTADPRGEEFPAFRSFWIEKPTLGDNALVIHALLDSPSVTGAYRFTLRPGEATLIDTELTLFPRTADRPFRPRAASRRPRCSRRSTAAAPTTCGRWSPRSMGCRC